ncbi:odorant receptor 49a-like [Odontomachus brunneus]|uniref:odorant receptor 49a-like n=1 Tax=Odontomachus brunneus TaxID=486640 RepID=UPI0013F1F2FF|nr:odorant receptor 49a-like [Odontomachus brunneus]
MDFQSVNPLNVRLNIISGNLLTMTADNTSFSTHWRIYSVLMWLLQIVIEIALIFGCLYVPKEKALQDGMICIVVSAEMFFIFLRLHACRDLEAQVIRRINDILRVADDTMKSIVITTMQPVQTPLQFYLIAGVISIIAWNCVPLVLLFEKDVFCYEDYRIPVAFSDQPFSTTTFLLGTFVLSVGTLYTFLKKVGVDVYMVHMVLMLTAQYRYIAVRMTTIFQNRNKNNEYQKTGSSEWEKTEMKALCQHHNTLIHITLLLKEILSLNFSVLYMNGVLRFCFIGIMMSAIPSTTFWEAVSILMYASGAIVQLYILCSCVQQLLDASTEVTDEAFHHKWYMCQSPIKKIFMLIIMANNLECKLATFEKFNLSLPSFMMILNQSYSIAVLFLKMK